MRVEKDGADWVVKDSQGQIVSRHATNSQAWRALDMATGSALNRAEATTEWVLRQD